MAYVVPIHKPSGVRTAIKLQLNGECLAVAKSNRVELYRVDGGLSLFHSFGVHGQIILLEKLRPSGSDNDHLLICTDRYRYFTLSWDGKSVRDVQVAVDIEDPTLTLASADFAIKKDPDNKVLVMEIYAGALTTLLLQKKGKRKEVEELGIAEHHRIEEMKVLSTAFLTGVSDPTLIMLHEIEDDQPLLKKYTFKNNDWVGEDLGVEVEAASLVIPTREGVLIVAETGFTSLTDEGIVDATRVLEKATNWTNAWDYVGDDILLADEYGMLFRIRPDLSFTTLGITSRASVLVTLGDYLFVGSHQGDSQVVQIDDFEVVQLLSSIAPVLDFSVMDLGSTDGLMNEYSSGQARLVTGSGAFNDGSLRSVRSGVGLEDVAMLGAMPGIRSLFSLGKKGHDILVASFVGETRVFHFDEEVEELDSFNGFALDKETVLAKDLPNGLLQVTSDEIIVSIEDVRRKSCPGILNAVFDHGSNQILVAVEKSLIMFDTALNVVAENNYQVEIASLASGLGLIAVGFWDGKLTIAKTDLTETYTEQLEGVPRSIQIVTMIEGQPMVFVSLGDGTLLQYNLNDGLTARKKIMLGKQQANLTVIPRSDGLSSLLAICEHASLIYAAEGKIVYSAVTAENAICVTPFNSATYPGSMVIATAQDVTISVIDNEKRTHVQTLPIHETVRRISYANPIKAFGIGTIGREIIDAQEEVCSYFKLVDEVAFEVLDVCELGLNELVEAVLYWQDKFVVGTASMNSDSETRGRMIVFDVTDDRKLKIVTELAIKGECRCLGNLDGLIVAALTKTVAVFALEYPTPSSASLVKKASYRVATAPTDMDVVGQTIAVADIMKSIAILEVVKTSLGPKLVEVGRHYESVWATSVSILGKETFLEADAEGNILMLSRNHTGITSQDMKRLVHTADFRLGEMVNRIRRIDMEPGTIVTPRAFLATVHGSIFLFATIEKAYIEVLFELQSRLASTIVVPGALAEDETREAAFNRYRAFKSQHKTMEDPFRVVDGELVEQFLDLDDAQQAEIANGLAGVGTVKDLESLRTLVESLRRLH